MESTKGESLLASLLQERRLTCRIARNASRIWLGIGSYTSSLCHCRGRGIGKGRIGSKSYSQGSSNTFIGCAVTGFEVVGTRRK
jgi:hypothetical protein